MNIHPDQGGRRFPESPTVWRSLILEIPVKNCPWNDTGWVPRLFADMLSSIAVDREAAKPNAPPA